MAIKIPRMYESEISTLLKCAIGKKLNKHMMSMRINLNLKYLNDFKNITLEYEWRQISSIIIR